MLRYVSVNAHFPYLWHLLTINKLHLYCFKGQKELDAESIYPTFLHARHA